MNSTRGHPADYIHHMIASPDRYTCMETARRQSQRDEILYRDDEARIEIVTQGRPGLLRTGGSPWGSASSPCCTWLAFGPSVFADKA